MTNSKLLNFIFKVNIKNWLKYDLFDFRYAVLLSLYEVKNYRYVQAGAINNRSYALVTLNQFQNEKKLFLMSCVTSVNKLFLNFNYIIIISDNFV